MSLVGGLLIAVLVSCAALPGPAPSDAQTWLEQQTQRHALPALGVVLVDDDSMRLLAVSGLRSMDHQVSVNSADQWHLGSVSKSMLATVAAVLVEQGLLGFDSTVGEILDDTFPERHPDHDAITLLQLLRHRSGLPEDLTGLSVWQEIDIRTLSATAQRQAMLTEILAVPPEFEPGSDFLYSNAGYVLAARMLETVSGIDWEQLIAETLFQPLGLQSAGIGPPGSAEVAAPDQPRGHRLDNGVLVSLAPGPFADHPAALTPAGRVHMNLDDLGRYLQLHLRALRGQEDSLLAAASLAALHEVEPGTGQAAGWFVDAPQGRRGPVSYHEGSNTFWWALVRIMPQENRALALVTNRLPEDLHILERMADALLRLEDHFQSADSGEED